MYLPYLRGKQFEFIALREIASELDNCSNVIPIIEPVKRELNSAKSAFIAMNKAKMKFALILNPVQGDFKNSNHDFLNSILELNLENWIPAFLIDNKTDEIIQTIKQNNFSEVMLVAPETIDIEKTHSLLSMEQVGYIAYGDADSRVLMRKLNQYNKKLIRLDDNFIAQKRNNDYRDFEQQKFTENHKFYIEDNFWGLADYTVIAKQYSEGGALPYVVAIHLTYEKTPDEIWVAHFASDSNSNGTENIQKKFFEATEKVECFFKDKIQTSAIRELIKFKEDDKYPGLGVIKKLSMKNHILLMNKF